MTAEECMLLLLNLYAAFALGAFTFCFVYELLEAIDQQRTMNAIRKIMDEDMRTSGQESNDAPLDAIGEDLRKRK